MTRQPNAELIARARLEAGINEGAEGEYPTELVEELAAALEETETRTGPVLIIENLADLHNEQVAALVAQEPVVPEQEPAPEGWYISLDDVEDDYGSWHYESKLWRLTPRRWPRRNKSYWRVVKSVFAGWHYPEKQHAENVARFRNYIERVTK